jgi:hypothetical protein
MFSVSSPHRKKNNISHNLTQPPRFHCGIVLLHWRVSARVHGISNAHSAGISQTIAQSSIKQQ